MNKYLTLVLLTVLVLQITACGKEVSIPQTATTNSDATPKAVVPAFVPNATIPPVITGNGSNSQTVSITYYQMSKTVAPVNGWITKTYTATGYCLVYGGDTYCWDDGIKTLQWNQSNNFYGPFTYTYWNMSLDAFGNSPDGINWSHANGGLGQDLMSTPRLISQALSINMATGAVNQVLTSGSATTVSCTDTAGVIDCGSFSVDTTQTPLN